ncbi:MAG: sulfatase [Halobacteriales archaeon]|nr:sulfatase [Halobacteriales archaeon]
MTARTENVVLVTVDSWRADALGDHMPEASSLAAEGARFDRAFAHGNWTPFSFPSILASRPAFADTGEIGVTGGPTLAETLSDAGFATAGFNAANGFLTEHWGYDAGFDEFDSFVTGADGYVSRFLATHPTVSSWVALARSPFRRLAAQARGRTTDRPFADVSKLVDVEERGTAFVESAEEPFFLWLHYMDAHTPYVPAPRYLREVSGARLGTHRMLSAHVRAGLGRGVGGRTLEGLRTLYRATLRQVDASLGRVLDSLEAAGVRDETAVVLAGDHGEEFMEHGHLAHYPKLYDELVHVPFVVDVPGVRGSAVDAHVGLDAIPPTICDLLDVPAPDGWAGESLLPAVVEGESPSEDPVVSVAVRGEEVTQQPIPRSLAEGELLVSARDDDWTYIEYAESGQRELYHRPSDPTQQVDLSGDLEGDAVSALERLAPAARDHAERLTAGATPDAGTAVDDEGLAQRLEALGYK